MLSCLPQARKEELQVLKAEKAQLLQTNRALAESRPATPVSPAHHDLPLAESHAVHNGSDSYSQQSYEQHRAESPLLSQQVQAAEGQIAKLCTGLGAACSQTAGLTSMQHLLETAYQAQASTRTTSVHSTEESKGSSEGSNPTSDDDSSRSTAHSTAHSTASQFEQAEQRYAEVQDQLQSAQQEKAALGAQLEDLADRELQLQRQHQRMKAVEAQLKTQIKQANHATKQAAAYPAEAKRLKRLSEEQAQAQGQHSDLQQQLADSRQANRKLQAAAAAAEQVTSELRAELKLAPVRESELRKEFEERELTSATAQRKARDDAEGTACLQLNSARQETARLLRVTASQAAQLASLQQRAKSAEASVSKLKVANSALKREAAAHAEQLSRQSEQLAALEGKAAVTEKRNSQLLHDKQFLQNQVATYMKQMSALQDSVKAARGELHKLQSMHQLSAELSGKLEAVEQRAQTAEELNAQLQLERTQLLHDNAALQQHNAALDTQLQMTQDRLDHLQRAAPAAAAPGVLCSIFGLPANKPISAQAVAAHPVFRGVEGHIYGPTGRKQGEALIKAVDILRLALEGVAADPHLKQFVYTVVVGGGYTEPGLPWVALNKQLDEDWKGLGLEELLEDAVGSENAGVLCGTHKYAKVAAMLMLGLMLHADMVHAVVPRSAQLKVGCLSSSSSVELFVTC